MAYSVHRAGVTSALHRGYIEGQKKIKNSMKNDKRMRNPDLPFLEKSLVIVMLYDQGAKNARIRQTSKFFLYIR